MLNLVGRYGATDVANRTGQAIYSVVTSPEYALQP
jgi:phosphate/sulfate permease